MISRIVACPGLAPHLVIVIIPMDVSVPGDVLIGPF